MSNLDPVDWMAAPASVWQPRPGNAAYETRQLISPIDGAAFASVTDSSAADVDRAVSRARRVFEAGDWAGQTPTARKRILLRWADLVEAHRDELARLDTLCMGMPRFLARDFGVQWAIDALRYYGEAIDKLTDEIAPTGNPVLALVTREAAGVVGVVLPWNWPLGLAAWKLAPALAMGCSVVAKPDEKTPLSLIRLAELGYEAGLPENTLEIVTGGPAVGEAMGRHPDIDVITFTGSGEVGRLFQRYAGESNMKAVWLECGGKGPNIIFADAPDLAAAATSAAFGIFLNSGQVCAAGSRLIVHESVHQQVLDIIIGTAQGLPIADPREVDCMIGPMASAGHRDRVAALIASGQAEGAQLVTGGRPALSSSGGFYLEPTVLDQVAPAMRVAQQEIFGPVLSVLTFRDADEAVRLANGTAYGLAGGMWTRDLDTAIKVSRRLKLGSVSVNCYGDDAHSMLVPFGGVGQSGHGRDKSLHALEKYVSLKTTWIKVSA
jgi:4-(gamma-glutamylamino)butanal dehydrogenase